MAIKNEFVPKFAVHPGRMLLEEIKARHMSQVEFAERTSMTPKHLSEIINGKAKYGLSGQRYRIPGKQLNG